MTSSSLCSTLTHACTACSLYRAIRVLLPDSVLPDDFRHWPHDPCQSFINFGLLNYQKISVRLASQLYLCYFYSFMFTLVMHCFMHNCICTVLLVTCLLCSLYGYSATLAAKLIINLNCDCDLMFITSTMYINCCVASYAFPCCLRAHVSRANLLLLFAYF